MSKNLIIESNEKNFILNLHNQEKKQVKKLISEQSQSKNRSEALKFFTDAKSAGCLTDANLDFTNVYKMAGENKVYIKGVSKTTGNAKRVYDDYTWKVVNSKGDVIKSGTWTCKKSEDVVVDNKGKLQEFKNQGYQEYKDVVLKTKIGDPKFYEVIDFKGVENDKLYRPLYSVNELGKIENWPEDSEQRKVLKELIDSGFIINPSQADLMKGGLEEYIPNVSASLFPNGLKVYIDARKRKELDTTKAQELITSKLDPATCEKDIQRYWDLYKNNESPTGSAFTSLKTKVQACANQNMYRWKDIGGVFGVGGGSRHLDNILEVMTNKRDKYENVNLPGNGTAWALNAPRIQGRR